MIICSVVTAPGMDKLKVPLVRPAKTVDGVSVWEWTGSAFDEGDAAAQWFSNYLGKPGRLVRFNDGTSLNPANLSLYRLIYSSC